MSDAGDRIRKLGDVIQDGIKDALKQSNFQKFCEQAADMIRLRTRLGFGVSRPGGAREKLTALSTGYVKRRAAARDLSPDTTPRRSNLTFTGQMLDSLDGRATGEGRGVVSPTGSRAGGLTNRKVAEYVSEERPFLNLTDTETTRVTDAIRKSIIDSINRQLKKNR